MAKIQTPRRLGVPPRERVGSKKCDDNATCPDFWEYPDGTVGVIGTDMALDPKTRLELDELHAQFDELGAQFRFPDAHIVIIPRQVFLDAMRDVVE